MVNEGRLILTEKQVLQKIRRIAFEIYENNFSEKQIWIAGIHDQGYIFASLLAKEIESISPIKVNLIGIGINKEDPEHSDVVLDTGAPAISNKCLILADDVLNTGKTLAYSLKSFLNQGVKKIETAVLVNRKHSLFPISATYTGYELSTTLTDHVQVVLTAKSKSVFLVD